MRKEIYIVSLLVCLASCTSNDSLENVINRNMTETVQYDPNRRSYTEAMEIAQNSIQMLQNDISGTRSFQPVRKLNLKNGVKAIGQNHTRSNGSALSNDTLLYIFNFDDSLGFAVVSASRQTDGLIAVTESGCYDPAIPTGNPAFETYMQMAKYYVAYADKTPIINTKSETRSTSGIQMCKPVYDTIFYQKIEPKIYVRWGQDGRMGQYYPNKNSGCCNTANAQIMSYFKYPSSLTLTYSERDSNSTILDWTAICNHQYTKCNANRDEADNQIGKLARQLGQLSESTFDLNTNTTSSNINKTRNALYSLEYNVGPIVDYNYMINNNVTDPDVGYPIASSLAEGKLICMKGNYSSSEGHTWVIDGCYYVKALQRMMCTYDGVNWSVYQELGTYRTCHNHINWGWNGLQNGYFESTVFNAYDWLQKDNDSLSQESINLNFYNDIQYFTVWH